MSRNLLENNQFPKPKETFQSIHVSFMWNYSYLKPNVHVSCAIPLLIWMETYHFFFQCFHGSVHHWNIIFLLTHEGSRLWQTNSVNMLLW